MHNDKLLATRVKWRTIRLELGRTEGFPNGSACRTYLLRLPLDDDGYVVDDQFAARPELATVRRFWPNEPDRNGYLVRKRGAWAFSYAPGDEDDESLLHLETHPIRAGEYLTVTEPDGTQLPFRIASCDC